MGEKTTGTIDVHVSARPSRLTRPIALALRVGRALRIAPSARLENWLIQWLVARSDVRLERSGTSCSADGLGES